MLSKKKGEKKNNSTLSWQRKHDWNYDNQIMNRIVGAGQRQARVRLGHYLKSIEIGSLILDFDFSFLGFFFLSFFDYFT